MSSNVVIVAAVVGAFLLLPFTESASLSGAAQKPEAAGKVSFQGLKLDVGKVIIDTDVGVDDAGAIFVALGEEKIHKKTKVVAITCVHGNAEIDHVVVNVLKTLNTVNRLDIPVYKGASKTIHVTPKGDNYFGVDGFGDFEYLNAPDPRKYLHKKHAVRALIDIVTEHPGEVTILALGPLTNIALAIRLDPLFLTKVRNVVVLGGTVEGMGNVLPGIEFNFYIDPEAAFIVFNATDTTVKNISPIILFPWDSVALRHHIPIAWRKNVLGKMNSPQVRLLNKADKTIQRATYYRSGDVLAAAITYRPDIVTATTSAYVNVLHYGEHGGAVFVDYQGSQHRPSNAIIVLEVEVESFKSMLLQDWA